MNKTDVKSMETITEQTLQEMLEELYAWYFKRARESHRKAKPDFYEIGRADGGIEAVEAVLLQVVGGKRLYELWEKQISDGEVESR